ncbi:MAG: tRNA (adenosine(37)-N6)-threonylcarbamoyltransferase complex dimerization subunit type 1 TsaB [Sedimentisphaerales bacterium]|nr:tRNA (adenosine(37)-N6)-threonylcarbamoyltransferase complex dimerization subunit type 1 TsaB [Sedimentisphaerales bacterium]
MKNNTDKPLIISLETSGRNGSVAIALGDEFLRQKEFSAPMKHSAELFGAIGDLLSDYDKKPQDINHVYISVGPGSFTGLRIAVTFAKSMNLANNSKIVAVDSLDVIAANLNDTDSAQQYTKIAVILDAKRNQFFIARYEIRNTKYEKTGTDILITAKDFKEQFISGDDPIRLLGEGLVYYKDKFKADGVNFLDEKHWWPQAKNVYKLGRQKALKGQFENPLKLQPFYLRQPQLGKSKILK